MPRTPAALTMRVTTGVILCSLLSCNGSSNPFEENLDITVCDPAAGPFSITFTNPYLPYVVGTQSTFQGNDGGDALELIVTVLDETQVVAGVTTRVIGRAHV